jgi:hypothetical protein
VAPAVASPRYAVYCAILPTACSHPIALTIRLSRVQAKAKSGEPREAAKAARIAALPVLEALCKAFPMGASKRVMAGLDYLWPWGHTALDLGKWKCGSRASALQLQTILVD